MKNILKGFREFVLRGSVVDLVVGVMVGAAFNSVVSSLVKDLMTPLIAAIFKQPNFSTFSFTIRGSQFLYGDFINNLIYFLIVLPINKLSSMHKKPGPAPEATTKECPECLSSIPVKARRCAYCTSVQAAAGATK